MSDRSIQLYFFLRKHKRAFWVSFSLVLMTILYLASGIRLKDDISGVSGKPGDDRFTFVVEHTSINDKLIIRLSLPDSSVKPDPSVLTSVAAELTDSLKSRFDSSFIKSLAGNVTDASMVYAMDFIYDNLPLFLDEQDYQHFDSIIDPALIRSSLMKDYRNLLSPGGFVIKNAILRDPLGLSGRALKKLRSLQGGNNFEVVDGFIMTPDHRNLIIFLTPANPPGETSLNAKLLNGLDDLLEKITSNVQPQVKAQYFGSIAVSMANARQARKDILITIIVALTLIILFTGWYFRSWKIPLLGFMPALFGGGLALAVLSLTKGSVSVVSLGIGSVILGLIVDYALYLITLFRKKANIVSALREMTMTIILCSLTTVVAFLFLVFLRSTVLNDLGWFAALSVLGAAFFSLIVLPQFLEGDKPGDFIHKPNIIDRISGFSFERSPVLTIILIAGVVVSLFFLHKVEFEDDMMALCYMPGPLKGMEQDLNKITGASQKTIFMVSTGNSLDEALKSRENCRKELKGLKDQGMVSSISGTDELLFPESVQNLKIKRWNAFWTTKRRDMVVKELETQGSRLHFRSGSFDQFTACLQKSYSPVSSSEIKKLTSGMLSEYVSYNSGTWMVTTLIRASQSNKPSVYRALGNKQGVILFDRQILTNNFIENVRHDFDLLIRLSMIFVTLLLFLSFGRIETGLVTAMPMFGSWLLTLGFMGISGYRFNIFNIIVSSFVFGLGVDYSILMMRGLLSWYKYGNKEIATYRLSVILSSATTLFGVGALFLALHPALSSIAPVSVFGIVAVVLFTLSIQPMLVKWLLLTRMKKRSYPLTLEIIIKSILTWNNIVLVAIVQILLGIFIYLLYPGSVKKKEFAFHWLFSKLCNLYILITFRSDLKVYNTGCEDFNKPAVIIGNHQSLIETPAFLRLHPKIIILTNNWVWNNPVFGPVARLASFFNAEHGISSILDQLREKVSEGYSILIFPEAHRYNDNKVHRFHKGAFWLAENLNIEILPVIVFGSGEFLGKGKFWGRPSGLRMKILPRIAPSDHAFGEGYVKRSKAIRDHVSRAYQTLLLEEGTGRYFRKKLILNYIYKGPVLEWYLRVKMKVEKYYQTYNELLPAKGRILDLGCGYGFLSYMMSYTSPGRIITGIDYDEEKIRVANNCPLKNDNLTFECRDITDYCMTEADGIVLSDVLHYITFDQQKDLLDRCFNSLRSGGVMLIKDADCADHEKHRVTRISELFSTRILGFNKTADSLHQLHFFSTNSILKYSVNCGLEAEIIKEARGTSNVLMIIRKK